MEKFDEYHGKKIRFLYIIHELKLTILEKNGILGIYSAEFVVKLSI